MKELTWIHTIGFVFPLICIIAIGYYAGKNVKDAKDFATGGSSSKTPILIGTLVGTLVGGASTIGTAQLAFTNGFSAIWFTLGGALGCLIMGMFFSSPFRKQGCKTIQEMITREYGATAGLFSSVFGSLGIFMNIVAQILAASALLVSVFRLNPTFASGLSAALMACYVIFGGVMGTGIVGIFKTVLMYFSVILAGILALKTAGGWSQLRASFDHSTYFNLVGRGVGLDLGAGISLILGVLTTQTYLQAMLSAKDDATAKRGAYLSALLIPPIGIGSVLVGLVMKLEHPDMLGSFSFTAFVLDHFPKLIGGVALGTLLIAVVGTGAGLSLGISSIIANDLLGEKRITGKELLVSRGIILVTLSAAFLLTLGSLGSIILEWSFLSMGLRAAVSFFPMFIILFVRKKCHPKCVVAAIIGGPVSMILAKLFLDINFDTLFIGMFVNLIFIVIGFVINERKSYG